MAACSSFIFIKQPSHVVLIAALAFAVKVLGMDDYSISQISPKSDFNDHHADLSIDPTQTQNIEIKPSLTPLEQDYYSRLKDCEELEQNIPKEFLNKPNEDVPKRLIRAASPIIERYIPDKSLEPSRQYDIGTNRIEMDVDRYADLKPTRTEEVLTWPGEGRRAPRGKALPLTGPAIAPSMTHDQMRTIISTNSERARQVNPDIQDIITSIVKLLNGNVNVQANTVAHQGRPLRPIQTRINNRGPPKISDAPAIPVDYDANTSQTEDGSDLLPPPPVSQMTPPAPPITTKPPVTAGKFPPPYPFENPPQRPFVNGIPLPEQLVPYGDTSKPVTKPNYNKFPWNRPYRPGSSKPAYPKIPPYKPLPPLDDGDELTFGGNFMAPNDARPYDNVGQTEVYHDLDTSPSSTEASRNETEVNPSREPPQIIEEQTTAANGTTVKPSVDVGTETNASKPALDESKDTKESKDTNDIKQDPIVSEINGVGEAIPLIETSIKDLESMVSKIQADVSSEQPTPTEELPSYSTTSTSTSTTTEFVSTTSEVSVIQNSIISSTALPKDSSYYSYRPRPGIVLDDTEYKPGRRPVSSTRPQIITPTRHYAPGDIFDLTVSAIQGPTDPAGDVGKPQVIPVDMDGMQLGAHEDIIVSSSGTEGFVSIDGKRTYLNLFDDSTTFKSIKPSKASSNAIQATGYAIPQVDVTPPPTKPAIVKQPTNRRPGFNKRPQPAVRIDTCIVGDDSTCDANQHEHCKTELSVSSCHCRPGYARRKHRDPCRRVVAVVMAIRVDRIYERRVAWDAKFLNVDTDEYRQLSYETSRAIASAMSMTPFSDDFMEAMVNNIFKGPATNPGVFVNLTMHLDEDAETRKPSVKGDIQRHILGAIQRRSNNIGNSALFVDGPIGAVFGLQDLNECASAELNDCHREATCTNVFGNFLCQCKPGTRDQWADNHARAGRKCDTCPMSYCNNRGQCRFEKGQQQCVCQGNYYGAQCEVDGEVVGVAVGASVTAIIIIVLTLICLIMWSRKWNREQKAAAAAAGMNGMGSPVFGYMAGTGGTVKTPTVGPPPYQLTLEDRMRWAHLADVMAQSNHYVQSEPGGGGGNAMFAGYPSLTMHHNTLSAPVPLPRLNLHMQTQPRANSVHNMNMRNQAAAAAAAAAMHQQQDSSSVSDDEDRTDLLGRNFQVPRPKSRSSIANQSGIYYDVEYDQSEMFKHQGGIPLSTYTPARSAFYRN